VLNAVDQGQDAVMFYNGIARNILGIWVEEDSEYQTPADLEGAKLGVGTADGIEVGFAKGVLADAGLKQGDYELVTVGDGGGAVAGLNGDDIDAYVGGGIDVAIMRVRGLALRNVVPDEYLWAFANGYAAKGEYIEQNPEIIEGFGRALTRGLVWSRENMDQAQEIAAEVNPEEGEDGDLARNLMETLDETYEPLNGEKFGYFPPDGWEKTQEQAIDAGDLKAPLPNLEEVYTNEFVEAFNEPAAGG
jgi:NitT/TauT family transport system substrate-binding protein